jgi:hypothetical protein
MAEDPGRNFSLEDSVLRAYYPHLCADCISAGFARDASLGHREWRLNRQLITFLSVGTNHPTDYRTGETTDVHRRDVGTSRRSRPRGVR